MNILQGSEKQVKWANDIREVVIKGVLTYRDTESKETNSVRKRRREKYIKLAEDTINILENETHSKYFIDNFSCILRNMERYKIEADVKEIDVYYLVGCKVLERIMEV